MAQHPQQQPQQQQHLSNADHNERHKQKQQQQQHQASNNQSNQLKTTTINNTYSPTRQQQQQLQLERDSKRTLIKNQLYLIEQLQLENANLRNERDQLQLENEELKFHLQMISSSNILNQPGPAFNDQQLERLVENDERINRIYHADLSSNSRAESHATPIVTSSLINQVKLLSTPLKHSTKQSADQLYLQQVSSDSANLQAPQPVVRQSLSSITSNGQQSSKTNRISEAAPATLQLTNKKSIDGKSTSLIAFTIKSIASAPKSRSLTHDDEEQQVKLVEQRYGGDSEQVQAAAVVIQRAFRKYQICKRFRTITEQLRHTYHSSINQPERKKISSSVRSPIQDINGCLTTNEVPYVSGTNRTAALQSLTHAASKLTAATIAASASGSTSSKKQLSDGVAVKQQNSSQQSVAIIQVPQLTSAYPSSSIPENNNTNNNNNNNNNCRETSRQADSVVAAAINFQQLESMRKRQYRVGLNIFNKNPEKGVSFLVAHSFIDSSSPYNKTSTSYYHSNQIHFIDKQHLVQLQVSPNNIQSCQLCHEEDNLKRNVAHFLLHRKGLAKEKIGQYLGNLQEQFNQDVLKYYLQELDFYGLQIDLALRKFLSTFRLPGEAQKIERIVDCFAQRYVQCQQQPQQQLTSNLANVNIAQLQLNYQNHQQQQLQSQEVQTQRNQINLQQQQQITTTTPNYKNNLILLSKDEIFILTFAIIMLNTDLHSPSLKPTYRMSSTQFVNNLRGVFKSQTINESDLIEIYERVKANQITTTPDHVTHVMKVQQGLTVTNFQRKELPNLCVPHRRLVCFCRLFEVYDVNKKERPGQHQREIFLFNDLLLVTKLARRVRANSTQLYTFRQSILLQGLYVQLFQSTYYNFGIKLCQRSNDEALIMFNARNELDQSRFVDDLGESIAEMDEMETIRTHDIIETIHFKYLKRLRRHALMHNNTNENIQPVNLSSDDNESNKIKESCDTKDTLSGKEVLTLSEKLDDCNTTVTPTLTFTGRAQSKFNSMLNLSSAYDNKADTTSREDEASRQSQSKSLRMNLPLLQTQRVVDQSNSDGGIRNNSDQTAGINRRCSTSSVHSLDSGLFLSRDVSPNQSS